jgi:hypothetical protein
LFKELYTQILVQIYGFKTTEIINCNIHALKIKMKVIDSVNVNTANTYNNANNANNAKNANNDNNDNNNNTPNTPNTTNTTKPSVHDKHVGQIKMSFKYDQIQSTKSGE